MPETPPTAYLRTRLEEITQALNEMEAAAGEHCPEELTTMRKSAEAAEGLITLLEIKP